MEKIDTLEALSPLIMAQFRKGVVTNAAFTPQTFQHEIEAGTLYVEQLPGALLLLRRREGFDRLNFYLQPEADLSRWQPEQVTMLEIPARARDTALLASHARWQQQGFQLLFTRQKLVRSTLTPDNTTDACVIRPADAGQLEAVLALLNRSYNPRTACLPTRQELLDDLEAGTVMAAFDPAGTLIGFLRMVCDRRVSECRHIAVEPHWRGRGVAPALFGCFDRVHPGRQQLWVATDNYPALRTYEKLGFQPDGWTSTVWMYDTERT